MVRDMEHGWWELGISLMSLLAFRQRALKDFQADPFELIVWARCRKNVPDAEFS